MGFLWWLSLSGLNCRLVLSFWLGHTGFQLPHRIPVCDCCNHIFFWLLFFMVKSFRSMTVKLSRINQGSCCLCVGQRPFSVNGCDYLQPLLSSCVAFQCLVPKTMLFFFFVRFILCKIEQKGFRRVGLNTLTASLDLALGASDALFWPSSCKRKQESVKSGAESHS